MTGMDALRIQTYSNSLEMLSEQKGAKLSRYTRAEQGVYGTKIHKMLAQVSPFEVSERTTRSEDNDNSTVQFDGRWVSWRYLHHDTERDKIDLMQLNLDPTSAIVTGQVSAMNRKKDRLFLEAFYGTAKTGETGDTSTTFTAGNQIAVTVGGGGSATGLNVEKLRAGRLKLIENSVDLDFEEVYMGLSGRKHDDLLALTQVTSADFNGSRPTLVDGVVRNFMGINFIVSEIFETDVNSYERCPMWVASGMGQAVWSPITGTIKELPNKKGNPYKIEAEMACGFTRLEEAKCVEIKCTR